MAFTKKEVKPLLSFHYDVPSDASILAYDPVQQTLAIGTRKGQIKLFGRYNTQSLLQSENVAPTKFLQFLDNQGILLNVNSENQIEVWDIVSRRLSSTHIFNREITSFTVLQQCLFIYVGDEDGDVSVLKYDSIQNKLLEMPYQIPFSKSYGECARETPVTNILPQPMTSIRVLIVFKDGLLALWDLKSSEVVFTTGKGLQHSMPKTVTSACWACTRGSKVVIGYRSGDVYVWSVPMLSNEKLSSEKCKNDANYARNVPLLKLNLGFKMHQVQVPIVYLRWVSGNKKMDRLYVNGFCDDLGKHQFQVVILNEKTRDCIIKLVLPLTEPCISAEHVFLSGDRNRHKQNALALLLKSGHLCLFDDLDIEQYLVDRQSKLFPNKPSEIVVSLPSFNFLVTTAELYTSNGSESLDEDPSAFMDKHPQYLSINAKQREEIHVGYASTGNLSKTKSLYITGHGDGTINFWDASCPLLLLILSLKQQTEASNLSSITSLHFDASSRILISGNQDGQVCIITFKKDASKNLSFLQEDEQCLLENRNVNTDKPFRGTASKNSLLVLCSETDIRLYSLTHAIQGTKRVDREKRLSGICCFASIIRSLSNRIGLLLVFTCGKIEIRSFPDLNILKETSLCSFKFSDDNSLRTSLSASSDGELIVINGDQEISFVTTLDKKHSYRHVECLSTVYRKDTSRQEESSCTINSPKEKKTGFLGKVIKDLKGSKVKKNDEVDNECSSTWDFEQLSSILETTNIPVVQEKGRSSGKQGVEPSIGNSKPKTGKKVDKGKLIVQDEEPLILVDQMKAKYGYQTDNEMNGGKMPENKSEDNVKKLRTRKGG